MPDDGVKRPQYAEGRDALLTAAARVVARDGFGGLTYRSVADAAGTTHGLVSYHFGSRDKLIHETVLKAKREAIDQSLLAPASGRLADFASHLSKLVAEAPDDQAFQFELALEARRREDLVGEVRALYDEYLKVTGEALRSFGIKADAALVRLIFAAVDGLTLQQLVYGRPQDTDAALKALRRILAGLAKPASRRQAR